MRLHLFAFLFLVFAAISCEQDTNIMLPSDSDICALKQQTHPKSEIFQKTLDEFTAKGIPGLSAFIQTSDGLVWTGSSGYARLEDNLPLDPCHHMYTASIGKTFCAAAVLLLVQDGVIDLDDPISNHLSKTDVSGFENADIITVRQLLNHSSGLTNLDWNDKFVSEIFQDPFGIMTSDLLDFERGRASLFTPGSDFNYSSTGYELLAKIIEVKTGNHAAFYTERIFQPLGLTETYYKNETSYPMPSNLVNGYLDRFDTEELENISNINNHLTSIFTGSDGLITTPQDLYTFLKGLNSDILFSDRIKTEMLDFFPTGGQTYVGYGLGLWQIKTDFGMAYGHDGDAIGAGADMWYLPEQDIYIVTATNLGTVLSDTKLSALYNETFLEKLLQVVVE